MLLYKYMSISGVAPSIETNSIGFSQARYFNDPFDSPKAEPVSTSDPISGFFEGVRASIKSISWEQNYAILSLTRTMSNALMWAHYADSHHGAVLEIDTTVAGLDDTNQCLIPAHLGSVVYTRSRPSGPYGSAFGKPFSLGNTHHFEMSHYEKFQRLFLTKPIDWAYEEEVRVVKCINEVTDKMGSVSTKSGIFNVIEHHSRPLYCFQMKDEAIKAIYLGVRTSEADEQAIKDVAGSFPVVRTHLDQKTYSISAGSTT